MITDEKAPPDITPPSLSGCPSEILATAELGTFGAAVNWTEPTAADESGNVDVIRSHQPLETYPIGSTGVAYIFRDPAGNTATCHFIITVETGLSHS